MALKKLPKLRYEYSALEPHIDGRTMTIHHTKHHQEISFKKVSAGKGCQNNRHQCDNEAARNKDQSIFLKNGDKVFACKTPRHSQKKIKSKFSDQ